MPSGDGMARLVAPAFDQPLDRHAQIGQEPPEPHLLRTVALRQLAHAYRAKREDASEKRRPL